MPDLNKLCGLRQNQHLRCIPGVLKQFLENGSFILLKEACSPICNKLYEGCILAVFSQNKRVVETCLTGRVCTTIGTLKLLNLGNLQQVEMLQLSDREQRNEKRIVSTIFEQFIANKLIKKATLRTVLKV